MLQEWKIWEDSYILDYPNQLRWRQVWINDYSHNYFLVDETKMPAT